MLFHVDPLAVCFDGYKCVLSARLRPGAQPGRIPEWRPQAAGAQRAKREKPGALEGRVRSVMRHLQLKPERICSNFRHPKIAYAA